MSVSDVAGYTFDIGISFDEGLIYLILLFVGGLKRNSVFDITFFMVRFIFPKMIGLNT